MITVYSKNNCMQCKMTKKFLEQHGANSRKLISMNILKKVDYVKSLGFTSAPVIEADNLVFSGFQPAKLKELI
ncbi:NrdH-redoxin [Streptococcus pyogenes]|uniref:glutaredoxin-like protein NrdH n=1 Tax=Streptococcus pyogenes TaxID=1314 RepID=UPI0007C47A3A|nr:glutaredoxin-like protein NrdH [Streptococcus pyogenes]OAC60451.1 NrdH-redoxin [Streptococcus pyogenes]